MNKIRNYFEIHLKYVENNQIKIKEYYTIHKDKVLDYDRDKPKNSLYSFNDINYEDTGDKNVKLSLKSVSGKISITNLFVCSKRKF